MGDPPDSKLIIDEDTEEVLDMQPLNLLIKPYGP